LISETNQSPEERENALERADGEMCWQAPVEFGERCPSYPTVAGVDFARLTCLSHRRTERQLSDEDGAPGIPTSESTRRGAETLLRARLTWYDLT
jgi:hypothetical protein